MSMAELTSFAHEAFRSLSESFRYMGLLIGCLVYLFCMEGKAKVRFLVYISMGILVLFQLPFFTGAVLHAVPQEEYVDLMWLLPSAFLIAYAAVRHFFAQKDRKGKVVWAAVCIVLLLLTGWYAGIKPENWDQINKEYYVNQEMMDICSLVPADQESLVVVYEEELGRTLRSLSGEIRVMYAEISVEQVEYDPEATHLILNRESLGAEMQLYPLVGETEHYLCFGLQ